MTCEWKKWCRLCSKENGNQIDIFIKSENYFSLSDSIQKLFSITITSYDEAPTKICEACHGILTSLISFSIQSAKVQEMFSELTLCDKFEPITDFESLREKYGLKFVPEFIKPSPQLTIEEIFQVNNTKQTNLNSDCDDDDDDDDDYYYDDDDDMDENEPIAKIKKRSMKVKKNTKIVTKVELNDEDISEDYHFESLDNETNDQDYYKAEVFNDQIEQKIDQEVKKENELKIRIVKLKSEKKIKPSEKRKRRPKVKKLKTDGDKDPSVSCEHCDRKFTTQGGLTLHLKNSHQIVKEPPKLPCTTCGKVYNSMAKLKDHENLHLPPEIRRYYHCPQCNQQFNSRSSISVHVRTQHQKVKSFICEECGKAFYFRAQLNVHKVTHSSEMPFQCLKCPKRFKSAVLLKYHADTHEDTKYVCPVCGTVLNTKSILRRHMVIHSDVQKHKCNFCDKSFKRSKTLKDHLILHTGLKPYQCPFCDLTFANGSNSRKHQKQSHPIELAEMEERGEKKACKNIPKLETLKAANAAAMIAINSTGALVNPLLNSTLQAAIKVDHDQ